MPPRTAPGAWASVVFAIIGLFPVLFCIVFAVVALVRSRDARRALALDPRLGGASLAVAGTVIGAVGVVEWMILVAMKIWAMI
jgi:hypothetical protein